MPRSPAQRHAFEGPIHVDPDATVRVRTAEPRCTCTRSPFCRGQASADWLTCSTGCRACQPDPWRTPTRTPAGAVNAREGDSDDA
jgi:hypothetical protein